MVEDVKKLGLTLGFDSATELEARKIPCDPALRRFCEQDICGQYKKCYVCPTAVGSPQTLIAQLHNYRQAVVFTKKYPCGDLSDIPAVEALRLQHERRTQLLWKCVQELGEGARGARTLGLGGCHLCEVCGIRTGEPCRHPDRACPSVSAYCIEVAKLAGLCGLDYTAPDGIVLFAIVLLR